LGQGFDRQHTGHDGITGEMALEEALVNADVFDADDVLI